MTKDKALQMCLEYIETDTHERKYVRHAIKEALANQEQDEPVAWMDVDEKGAASGLRYWSEPDNRHEVALYTTPQQSEARGLSQQRKPLTDERLELIGHADLAINNIYIFNGYGEDVPEGRTPIYAGYKAAHCIKE